MTKTINFIVPGVPVAKGRARSFIRAGHVAHYTPEQTARYENLVKMAARQAMGSWEPMQGAVELVLLLHMPVPASWSQKRRTAALSGQVRPTTKPDCSNVLKAVEDAMNGVVFVDDKQIADVTICKRYAATPQACVQVTEVPHGQNIEV